MCVCLSIVLSVLKKLKMGRKNTNPVGKLYFTYDLSKDHSVCNIVGCPRPILKGKHSRNLETHIKTTHPIESNILTSKKNDKSKNDIDESFVSTVDVQTSKKRGPLDSIITVTKRKCLVNIDKTVLLKACTEMVTVNGRPFTIFHDSGFRRILDPLSEAIGQGFKINSHNIKSHIESTAKEIIEEITNTVKNQLISLKLDCVKRHNRCIMGVNVQFINEGQLQLKTLAMVEINEQNTSENLKTALLEVLQKYFIKKEQIYSITCDNASNMIKLARILNECPVINDIETAESEIFQQNEDQSDDVYDSKNDEGTLSIEEIEQFFEENNDESNTEIQIFESNVIDSINPEEITSCVRCAVHTLQLCILDGFKAAPITDCINHARQVVKKLRTPKFASRLKKKNFKFAILDNDTRWNSLFNMLNRLLELKQFCLLYQEKFPEIKLTENEWKSVQAIVDALNPVKIATMALQKQDLILGDFYAIWWKASSGLKANGSILAKEIFKSMEQRQKNVLKSNVFLAAIYLDPRYQCILTEEENNIAIHHLTKTWKYLEALNFVSNGDLTEINSPIVSDANSVHDEDEFENFLLSQSSSESNNNDLTSSSNFTQILNKFKGVKREPKEMNVLQYWENRKKENIELYNLSKVVLAVPATQVSVERSFSSLKFILSDLRASLSPTILEAIMIIRNNIIFKH